MDKEAVRIVNNVIALGVTVLGVLSLIHVITTDEATGWTTTLQAIGTTVLGPIITIVSEFLRSQVWSKDSVRKVVSNA